MYIVRISSFFLTWTRFECINLWNNVGELKNWSSFIALQEYAWVSSFSGAHAPPWDALHGRRRRVDIRWRDAIRRPERVRHGCSGGQATREVRITRFLIETVHMNFISRSCSSARSADNAASCFKNNYFSWRLGDASEGLKVSALCMNVTNTRLAVAYTSGLVIHLANY